MTIRTTTLMTTQFTLAARKAIVLAVLPVGMWTNLPAIAQTTPATSPAQATPAAQAERTWPNDAYLAERLTDFAQRSFEAAGAGDADMLRAGQLLHQAAQRLNPTDARLAQLAVDAAIATGDTAATLEMTLKLARIDPSDRLVQQRLVGLYAARSQTTTARIAYLNDMIGKTPVPEEVRSHAAFLVAQAYLERGERTQAIQSLAQSLRLNPLNVDAVKLQYELVGAVGTPFEQVRGLLAVLRAAPTDAGAATELAQLLARVGLRQQALYWYDVSLALVQRSGQAPTADFVIDYAVQLYLSGDSKSAETLVDSLLRFDSDMVEAALLKAVVSRGAPAGPADIAAARGALRRTLNRLAAEITKQPAPTTQASEAIVGDASTLLAAAKDAGAEGQAVSLLSDLAFVTLYSSPAATDADRGEADGIVTALREFRGPTDMTVQRLEGWQLIAAGKTAEARLKLDAVAEKDALAELGIIQIAEADAASQTLANTKARGLLTRYQAGLVGAVVYQALKERGVEAPTSDTAEAIKTELNQFPEKLLGIIDRPQDFYAVRADPLSVIVKYGQPMLARVTIANTSQFDLTIANGGAIRPDIWMDATIRGANSRLFGSTSLTRLSSTTVLKSRQSISQIVRLDRGSLGISLANAPEGTFATYGTVVLNPVMVPARMPDGTVGQAVQPGPAGYAVQFARLFERSPLRGTTDADRDRLYSLVRTAPPSGTADLRASGIEVLGVYLRAMSSGEQKDDIKAEIAKMKQALSDAAKTEDGALRALALFQLLGASGTDSPALAAQMAKDPDWRVRMGAILAARPGQPAPELEQLNTDSDPIVAGLAKSMAAVRARLSQ